MPKDDFLAHERALVDQAVRNLNAPTPPATAPARRTHQPEPRVVEGRVLPRAEPEPLDIPPPRRERNPDAATARVHNMRGLWVQLSVTLPAFVLAGLIVCLLLIVFTKSWVLGLIVGSLAALVPFTLWMVSWTRQAIRHQRGTAGPPPGWMGRHLRL